VGERYLAADAAWAVGLRVDQAGFAANTYLSVKARPCLSRLGLAAETGRDWKFSY
jgi:hypothetical protein